ncbi:HNH endonuclease family protein [Nocardioides fonticola]|uniref:HNH endonuclease family protein n=1 Tax=Nocardioides fonticola TaxID=450363 RepID=A0ABP7X8R7_9ACTN
MTNPPRRTVRSSLGAAIATIVLLTLSPLAAPSPVRAVEAGRAGERVVTTTAAALAALPVAAETPDGYDRDLFRHWIDADGDGCDTRDEVLIVENRSSSMTVGSGCALDDGRWRSWYDAVVTTDPSTFDIDHLVPLAEAWASGARSWSAQRRQDFANDLGDARALVAVTASSNRSKSDRDPAEWLPAKHRCRYTAWWLAVKSRWSLAIDSAERDALTALVDRCGSRRLAYRPASSSNS